MKRYKLNYNIHIYLSILVLSIINCNGKPGVIDWPEIHNQIDTLLSPTKMIYIENARVEAYTPWGRIGSSIGAFNGGVLVSEYAINDGIGIGCFDWDGSLIWSALPVYNTRSHLGPAMAIAIDNEKKIIIQSAPEFQIWKFSMETGECISSNTLVPSVLEDVFFGESDHDFPAASSVSLSERNIACAWNGIISVNVSGVCISVFKSENMEELFSVKCDPVLRENSTSLAACVALTDSTVFIANGAEDKIFELSMDGGVIRTIVGEHSQQRPLFPLSVRGEPLHIQNRVISQIAFTSPDILWVLYGSGSFTPDSSEIWRVDLSNMNCSYISFSRIAKNFAVYAENIVVLFSPNDVDPITLEWDEDNCYLSLGSWKMD